MIPRIIAHRGNSHDCHENTMAAFARAVADGADGIELDLRLTGDRHWVVHHDTHVLNGGRRRRIADMTMQEAAVVRVGANGDPLPMLIEVLDWAKTIRQTLVLDIKDTDGADELIAAVEAAALPVAPVFSSFRKSVLRAISRRRPTWKRALILDDPRSAIVRQFYGRAMVRWARRRHLAALHMQERWVTPSLVARMARAHMNLAVWTVDDPTRMVLLAALGVHAIITNRPDVARITLGQMAPATEGA
ncbi:MAG: glycerophosphodiester phosphodiesterase [Candidatus Zixiibacteriota bacterium]